MHSTDNETCLAVSEKCHANGLGWLQVPAHFRDRDGIPLCARCRGGLAGVTVIVSDFLTEATTDPTQDCLEKTMSILDFTKQRPASLSFFHDKMEYIYL